METGATFETLNHFRGRSFSERNLRRRFHSFLNQPPKVEPLDPDSPHPVYLKIDGHYFGHWGCLLVFKEGTNIIFWAFVDRENYANYSRNLGRLAESGYDILGMTSDWHGSLVSSVKSVFPDIPDQRCLVHTWHLCQRLLTKHPATEAGRNLRELAGLLNGVKTLGEKGVWLAGLRRFEREYGDFIHQRTYHEPACAGRDGRHWWFTHRNLRRAFRTLKSSRPNLFIYLDNPLIEKDTNGLESEFSHLGDKLAHRRGLKRDTSFALTNSLSFRA